MADKATQDKIVGSVRHRGTTYRAGDEDAFAVAVKSKDSGLDKDELRRLADRGTIVGFGTGATEADDDKAETPKSKKAKR